MQGELRLCRLLANGLDVPCAPGQGGGAERALLGSTRVLPKSLRTADSVHTCTQARGEM